MQYLLKLLYRALVPALLVSCSGNHLITDKDYLAKTEKAFSERKDLASARDSILFNIFEKDLSVEQNEALKFLFAYMPLNDLADYSGEFFHAQAERALMARNTVTWGRDIPEDIFLHYVLPYRINNENLDSFRIAYFDEIHERIKGMDLEKAALEINYWSHEKVAYQPADIRTSAPMSTILSARGRCGEESTLTVSALRTAGIPARQVYTPRWAHIDDNHAWVEVWVDGTWKYMGACEPELKFDRGWFTEYARRAMLVHTKSFGAPYGEENVININRNFTEVNNLPKYAETKKLHVSVSDAEGKPAKGALVEFGLYNYSEFFPITTIPADKNGISSLETGFGDLLIWARKGNAYAWKLISVGKTDTVRLRLGNHEAIEFSVDADIYAPVLPEPFAGPSEVELKKNAERIEIGNVIRKSYLDSWIKQDEISAIAGKLKADQERTREIFTRSMGNYKEIRKFLLSVPDTLIEKAFSLLEVLPDKDLRDTKSSILNDHLLNVAANAGISTDMFRDDVLNPRIDNEMMVAWRSYMLKSLPAEVQNNAKEDPSSIKAFLERTIRIEEEENYYGTPITPIGVVELKVSDVHSRAICFVAICRSLGIPSRLEPGRNIPQYWSDNSWYDVYFEDQEEYTGEKGFVKLLTEQNPEPKYYTNFTIARFDNGRYNTLEYDFNKKVTEFEELGLPAGSYMLVTGNRPDENMILAKISFFELSGGEHKSLNVNLRSPEEKDEIAGTADIKTILGLFPSAKGLSSGKPLVITWYSPDHEPSRHVFTDLPAYKMELNAWGGNFLFISSVQPPVTFDGLPDKSIFSADPGLKILEQCVKFTHSEKTSLPLIIIVNDREEIVFKSSGYTIGIGEQILRHVQ